MSGESSRRIGLVPLRAGGDEAEGRADQLLEPLEIAPRFAGRSDSFLARRRRAPALDLLVDGLGSATHVLVSGNSVRVSPRCR